MVRLIGAALADFRVPLLELAGIVLIAVFIAIVAGPVWILLVVGVAVLLKSAELDAKSKPPRR